MLVAQLQNFLGANTLRNAKKLPEGVGTDARNLDIRSADFRGILAPLAVYTITGSIPQQISLYRFGRDTPSDTATWLSTNVDADYARSMLSEDLTERTYITKTGSIPKYTDTTLVGATPPLPVGLVDLGVPAPAGAMTAAINTAGTGPSETRVYLDVFKRANGDRSAPNPGTTSITVPGGSTVNLSALAAVPGGAHGITLREIYVFNGSGEFMRCVTQLASLTTATDTGSRDLVLESGGSTSRPTWLTPPDGLFGILEFINGMMIAFLGKSYRCCVPYKPHAWPFEYERIIPDTVVGGAVYGSTVVVLTTGTPRLVTGSTPYALNDSPLLTQFSGACRSKRGIKSVRHGVCWPTNDGLAYTGQYGTALITEALLSKAAWRALGPSTMLGARWGRWYLCIYSTTQSFMIDPANPTSIIWLDVGAYGAFEDPISGDLYLIGAGNVISKFDAGAVMTASFTSPVQRTQRAVCPMWGRVLASAWPQTYKLYADGVLKHTEVVTSEEPFMMPGEYMASNFQIQLSGPGPAEAAEAATAIEDIR